MTGFARIQEFGDHYTLHGYGTVTTTDGWTGTFNREYVINGDHVITMRFHDMELSNGGTHQKIVFAVGLLHVTYVDGIPTADVLHFGIPNGIGCVGKP